MRILLPFAIGLIPVSIIGLNSIWNFPVERYLISYFDSSIYSGNPFLIVKLLLYEIVTVFYIIAALSYFISPFPAWKERVYSILRCTFCIHFLFSVPYFGYSLFNFTPDWNNASGYYAILRFIINLFISLVLFSARIHLPVPSVNLDDYVLVEYASKSTRLVHHITDLFFLMAISETWYMIINANLSFSIDTGLLLLTLIGSYFFYFFLSEALFRQTPGQAISNSCVAGVNRKTSTARIFLRSLGRLIPLNNLSFLWGGNWHDKVSGTTVVHKNSWKDLHFDAER